MSTSFEEEGPERTGVNPLEVTTTFLDANQRLLDAALLTYRAPSEEMIGAIINAKKGVIIGLTPFVESEFYRVSRDRDLVDVSVGAVMGATKQLWELAQELRPDDPTLHEFSEEFRTIAVGSLLGELDVEQHPHDQAVSLLYGTYERAADNLVGKVLTSDKVVAYQMRTASTETRRRDLINYSAVGAAAFLGTSLALLLSRRKSRD